MPKTHCRLFQIGDDDIREHSTIIEPNASSSLSEMRGPSSSLQVSAYLPDWKNSIAAKRLRRRISLGKCQM